MWLLRGYSCWNVKCQFSAHLISRDFSKAFKLAKFWQNSPRQKMTKYAIVTKGFFLDSKFLVQALIPINYLHTVGKAFISLLEDLWGNTNSLTRKVNVMLQRKKWGPSQLKLGGIPSLSHILLSFLTLNMQMRYGNQKSNTFLSWLATPIYFFISLLQTLAKILQFRD